MKILLSTAFLLLLFSLDAGAQCPTVSVTGPAAITQPGDSMVFRAVVNGGEAKKIYAWSVDKGTIIEGQGTPVIVVATDNSVAGDNLTATVEIVDSKGECRSRASALGPVANRLEWGSIDEWDTSSTDNEQRARLDAFFAELANNPDQIGLVVIRRGKGDRSGLKNRSLKLVVNHATFRKFDLARIWFCMSPDTSRVRIYRFRPELHDELPVECKVIKGADIPLRRKS